MPYTPNFYIFEVTHYLPFAYSLKPWCRRTSRIFVGERPSAPLHRLLQGRPHLRRRSRHHNRSRSECRPPAGPHRRPVVYARHNFTAVSERLTDRPDIHDRPLSAIVPQRHRFTGFTAVAVLGIGRRLRFYLYNGKLSSGFIL